MRLQFEVTPVEHRRLEELKKELGLTTKKELFQNAMSLLIWAVKQAKQGRVIASVDDGFTHTIGDVAESYRELVMPILDNVQTKKIRS